MKFSLLSEYSLKIISTLALVLMVSYGKAQNPRDTILDGALEKYSFGEYEIVDNSDTITYYLKNYKARPSNLVVFIQGTDPSPIFFYSLQEGQKVQERLQIP